MSKAEDKGKLFNDLFHQFKEKLYRLCYSYCNSNALAEDLLQESFSKIWIHLDTFRQECSYSTWMYRITANTCLMYLRTHKKNPVILQEVNADHHATESYTEAPVNALIAAITKLDDLERMIITMLLDEVSYKEIAAVLGISENNVGVKVHRIKQQLKRLLSNKIDHG